MFEACPYLHESYFYTEAYSEANVGLEGVHH